MDPATNEPASDGIFRLIYCSRSRVPEQDRRAELGRLFSTARSNNKKRAVTGALFITDDCFVQTLEGDESVVRALFRRISTDRRHEQVQLPEAGAVPGRVFARWAMAKVGGDDEPDIPLIAHVDGISKAAPREVATPDQEGILTIMRAAAAGQVTSGVAGA
ncbi:MAG: BLUF domain-containing protein [Pseudorhodobacter sp.]|nr:BLUF domain-containing protein [Frankiaceae bacterium]